MIIIPATIIASSVAGIQINRSVHIPPENAGYIASLIGGGIGGIVGLIAGVLTGFILKEFKAPLILIGAVVGVVLSINSGLGYLGIALGALIGGSIGSAFGHVISEDFSKPGTFLNIVGDIILTIVLIAPLLLSIYLMFVPSSTLKSIGSKYPILIPWAEFLFDIKDFFVEFVRLWIDSRII